MTMSDGMTESDGLICSLCGSKSDLVLVGKYIRCNRCGRAFSIGIEKKGLFSKKIESINDVVREPSIDYLNQYDRNIFSLREENKKLETIKEKLSIQIDEQIEKERELNNRINELDEQLLLLEKDNNALLLGHSLDVNRINQLDNDKAQLSTVINNNQELIKSLDRICNDIILNEWKVPWDVEHRSIVDTLSFIINTFRSLAISDKDAISALREDVDESEVVIRQLKEEIDDREQKERETCEHIELLNAEIIHLKQSNQSVKKMVIDKNDSIDQLEKRFSVISEEKSILEKRLSSADSFIQSLKKSLEIGNNINASLLDHLLFQRKVNAQIRKQYSLLLMSNDYLRSELESKNNSIFILKNELDSTSKDYRNSLKLVEKSVEDLDTLKKDLSEQATVNKDLNELVSKLKESIEGYSDQHIIDNNQLLDREGIISELKHNLEEKIHNCDDLSRMLSEEKVINSKLATELELLKDNIHNSNINSIDSCSSELLEKDDIIKELKIQLDVLSEEYNSLSVQLIEEKSANNLLREQLSLDRNEPIAHDGLGGERNEQSMGVGCSSDGIIIDSADPPLNNKTISIDSNGSIMIKALIDYLSGFDSSESVDQGLYLYQFIIDLYYHLPDGTIVNNDFSSLVDHTIIDGSEELIVNFTSEYVRKQSIQRIQFALFYVNNELLYCVPFTVSDHHYVDEVMHEQFIPKKRHYKGKWIKNEDSSSMEEMYYAEYTLSDDEHTIFLHSMWDVNTIADLIVSDKMIIRLDNVDVNLLDTYYSKYTGISKENYQSQKSRTFCQWLSYYGIPYADAVRGYSINETNQGLVLRTKGYFCIGYSDKFDDALSFLEEYEIYFNRTIQSSMLIKGYPALYLSNETIIDDESEAEDAYDELYPVKVQIPPLNRVRTEYSTIRYNRPITNVSAKNRQNIVDSNRRIIEVFNSDYHPECLFSIINDDDHTVELTKYNGNSTEYEIPSMVLLDKDSSISYHVTVIGAESFSGNQIIEMISVPNSIISIRSKAFSDCVNLKDIILPDCISDVSNDAFIGCDHLKESGVLLDQFNHSNDDASDSFIYVEEEDSHDYCLDDSSDMEKFLSELTPLELSYLKVIMCGNDVNLFLKNNGVRKDVIDCRINAKAIDYFDDTGIIEDYSINEEYLEDLERYLGD